MAELLKCECGVVNISKYECRVIEATKCERRSVARSQCECQRAADAAEWLRTTDEVISSRTDITDLEAGTTYELRIVATNGGVTRASNIEEVTTDGTGWFA